MRHPPRSPLFPYTTLFRSVLPLVAAEPRTATIEVLPGRVHADGTTGFPVRLGILDRFGNAVADARPEVSADVGTVAPPEDRKSTRLNSSHVEISYAVFCLK